MDTCFFYIGARCPVCNKAEAFCGGDIIDEIYNHAFDPDKEVIGFEIACTTQACEGSYDAIEEFQKFQKDANDPDY